MKKLVFFFIALFSVAAFVSAQPKQRVAVLPSVGDLDPQRLILLTDKVREIATKNLPIDNFNILKQDVITRMIGEEELYRSCKEGVCIGDLAKKTNANYGARCDVVTLDNSLVLKFELYSVNEEVIFETFTDYGVNDFRGMLASLEARLPDVFKKMADVSQSREITDDADGVEYGGQVTITPKPEPAKPEPPPVSVVQEIAQVQPVYRTGYKWVDQSGDKPRIFQNRISLEFDYGGGYIYYRSSYGETAGPNPPVRDSGSTGGFGARFRFDLKYFEFYEDMFMIPDSDPDSGIMGNVVVCGLAKYPFVFDQVPVKMTPILGFGMINLFEETLGGGFAFGGRIDVGISKIAYLHSEYLYIVGIEGGSGAMSLKAGGGLDIGWGKKKKAFWRTELMYNLLSAYYSNYTKQNIYGEDEEKQDGKGAIHYVNIRTGIGYKWGGVKKVPIKIQEIEVE